MTAAEAGADIASAEIKAADARTRYFMTHSQFPNA